MAVDQSNAPLVVCENLVKIYKAKDIEVLALQGLDLTIERGELMAVIGNSGSGKSTLLNMLGGLDRPSAGKLTVDGQNLFKLTEGELVAYKRLVTGFVWQNNARNLLPYLSAWQNVQMPMLFGDGEQKKNRTLELLDLVGMGHRKHHKLSQMSGGEQQRVAIAIALANRPKLLLADEPTGSVDAQNAQMILDIFRMLNHETGLTIVIVTHDRALSKQVTREVTIRDGKISSERVMRESYAGRMAALGSLSETEQTHDEYVIIDRVGRLQLPRQMIDQMDLADNKVKVGFDRGKIIIENPKTEKRT